MHQWATSPGGAGTPLATPTRLVGPTCPPSTYSSSHLLLLPPEKIVSQLKPVFLLFLLGFSISLCKAPFTKLFWGNYSLVSDSSIGPISFCSSALYSAYFCCLGDHVLELCMLILALLLVLLSLVHFSSGSLKFLEKEDVQEKLSWWFLKQERSPSCDSGA